MYILCHCYIFLSYTSILFFFFFNDTATTEIYTLSLHDALPIFFSSTLELDQLLPLIGSKFRELLECQTIRSEEHTSELQSRQYLVCRLLLEKKKKKATTRASVSYALRGIAVTSLSRSS